MSMAADDYLGRVLKQLLEGLGGIQQIVAKLGGQLTQLLLDLIEPLLGRALYTSPEVH